MCRYFAIKKCDIRSTRERRKGKGPLYAFEVPFPVLNFRKYVYILLVMKIFYISISLSFSNTLLNGITFNIFFNTRLYFFMLGLIYSMVQIVL